MLTWVGVLLTVLGVGLVTASDNLTSPSPVLVGQDPDDGPLDQRHLALVINQNDPLSQAIGRHYIRARQLPDSQVIRVSIPADRTDISAKDFRTLRHSVLRQTPSHVQVYALAWAQPYRVGCQSITSAFAHGLDIAESCGGRCGASVTNPYFARGDIRRPWSQLGIRPTMMLAATSPWEARRLIDRGVAADGSRPPGTAYLLSTDDSARNVRAARFLSIASTIGPTFRVRVLQGNTLRGAGDVMAYFTGLAFVEDLRSNRFRPGAVADHLTSLGGQLTDSSQMSVLRWLEAGATGSYGTVSEPCNMTGKFPDPGLVLAYYLRGDTLIEAYWRSVALPSQGVFVGEPLARPWPVRAESSGDKHQGVGVMERP
ncbi:TIGR03790 family protein [Cyanobium sp. FGCU-6]|jgi:uncharacterized protein (TIGR03790 family)|nr:TIGR03790 family protein [Cyanobium sp. FGCU6]